MKRRKSELWAGLKKSPETKVFRKTADAGRKHFRNSIFLLLMACMLLISGTCVYADTAELLGDSNLPVLDTDVSTPSDECFFVGLQGIFCGDDETALEIINEIRWEACTAGNVPDPRNSDRMLTEADYVPIKWSTDLERIARVRAYEAAISLAHQRLNGLSIWSLSSNGVRSYGEVLAWNWSTNMAYGIYQWYDEKEDWVEQNSGTVTGHYTQMIDPDHTYVGLGCFCSDYTYFYNSTAGEFNYSTAELDSEMLEPTDEVIQKIEVWKENVSEYQLTADKTSIKVGETTGLTLEAMLQCYLPVLDGAEYQSADSKTVSVSRNGTVKGVREGKTTVSALIDGEVVASVQITVKTSSTSVTAGWKQNDTGWWYQNADGTYPKNTWKKIDGKWYHFDSKGYMQTGWLKLDDTWYYLKSNGAMATGWLKIGSDYYYFKDNGSMAHDTWVNDYYLLSSGKMAKDTWIGEKYVDSSGKYDPTKVKVAEGWKQNSTGWWYQNADGTYPKNTWKKINGKWYHFDSKGYMQTGWLKIDNTWYYLKSNGVMATGWLKIGSDYYYFNDNGSMAKETWVGDYYLLSSGKMARNTWIGKYHVDENGRWDMTKR